MDQFVFKCKIPPTVYIAKSKLFETGLFSKQNFKKGDVIYENNAIFFDIDKIPEKIMLETDQGNFEIDIKLHTSPYFENQYFMQAKRINRRPATTSLQIAGPTMCSIGTMSK